MSLDTLKDVYLDQLQDLFAACSQIMSVMDDLERLSKSEYLAVAIAEAKKDMSDGLEAARKTLVSHGVDPLDGHSKGVTGLVSEARHRVLEQEFSDLDARDAVIITQYQHMTHYAIAGFGCCAAFAKRLGMVGDSATMDQCLKAFYAGDRRLTEVAETKVNMRIA